MPKVYIVKGKKSYENTQKLLEKAGGEFLNNLKSPLIIKPNLVIDNKIECATTDPQVVKAVVDFISSHTSVDKIIIADGSGRDTERAFDALGYRTIFDALSIPLRDLNKDKPVWIDIIEPLTGRPAKLPIAESVINAGYIISCAIPKTHDHGIVTLGLKNLVGVIPGIKWKKSLHGGRYPDEMSDEELERSIVGFHQNLLAIFKKVRIDFSIIDGTCGMEGNGPIGGNPKQTNFSTGGTDPVATDAITAYLMGFDPYEIGYIYLSEKTGLGVADISKIEVEGADWMKLRKRFKPHHRYSHMNFKAY
jgi:uncharacterized protein (DUF362 family)